ncbi:MAG: SAM-dependent methyltransferase [Oscillospiraceae bacterium]|nr:SAM-dependent methyltransferase [Oscillospiraceae bacterium]
MINFNDIQKIIFSSKSAKLTGHRIKIKEKDYIQFESFYNNQAFHENILLENLHDFFRENILKYKQADIFLTNSHYMAFNKNSEILFYKTKDKIINIKTKEHNRRKNYIITEGDNIPVFIELGIFTKDFKIINSMYNKFKQINRFVELFNDMSGKFDEIYKKYNKINIIDFGCGKSYLTFILYYYFINIKKFPEDFIKITGIDLKEKVVENCNLLAPKYGYKNLSFETGDIKNYKPKFMPNIVVSLHGCDTVTDYALYNALKWQSDIIFAAPCCEHEINSQININLMRNILKYGIIKERFSALLTNSIRCNILEIKNYKTELIEFVDITHSPKNLLIRAIKNNTGINKNQVDKIKIQKELDETLKKFEINQTLNNLINN